MNRLLMIGLVAVLTLTGCTATTTEAEPTESAVPRIEAGPVLLTNEEAGERYLSIVCQLNSSAGSLAAAFGEGEEEFLNGGEPSLEAVHAAAAEKQRAARLAIEVFDDDYYTWPDSVAEFVPHVRSQYMAEMSTLGAIANSTRYEEGYYAAWPEATPEQQSAGQEIRYQLGLDADTVGSCVGYEAALDPLHTEMIKFNEELAAQEKRDAETEK